MIHSNLNTIFYTHVEHCQPFVPFGLQGWGEVEGGLTGGGGGLLPDTGDISCTLNVFI